MERGGRGNGLDFSIVKAVQICRGGEGMQMVLYLLWCHIKWTGGIRFGIFVTTQVWILCFCSWRLDLLQLAKITCSFFFFKYLFSIKCEAFSSSLLGLEGRIVTWVLCVFSLKSHTLIGYCSAGWVSKVWCGGFFFFFFCFLGFSHVSNSSDFVDL